MRESGLYTTQLQTNLMAFAPQYDNITPYGEATPNRQAAVIKIGYENKKSPLTVNATYYRGQEVRGEGTTTLRGFERYEVDASFNAGRFISTDDKDASIQIRVRNDRTTRPGTESVPGINLSSRTLTAGMDFEFKKQWHLVGAFQLLTYKGFELKSIRDFNQEIYNFSELNLEGSEQLASAGLKYSFSDKAFLSVQYYKFFNHNNEMEEALFTNKQWMLLYQINF
jgi:hypothetical protein